MSPLYAWLIAYAAPALIAGSIVKSVPKKSSGPNVRNAVFTHVMLLLSGLLGQYFIYSSDLAFPWFQNIWSIAIYALSVLIAVLIIGHNGALYSLSALVQQFSMLSIAYFLFPSYSIPLIILLIAPIFAWCHTMKTKKWILRILLFLAWGSISVIIFSISKNIYLVSAMHALLGSILISKSVIYPTE